MNVRRTLLVWIGLVSLLALTIGASFLPLGMALPFVSYGIAIAKTALVVWFFMEMREENGLHRLALVAGGLWALILLILMISDPLTRGWLGGG